MRHPSAILLMLSRIGRDAEIGEDGLDGWGSDRFRPEHSY
jgi:hypothetical protein